MGLPAIGCAAIGGAAGARLLIAGAALGYTGFGNGGGLPAITCGSLSGPNTDNNGYVINAIAKNSFDSRLYYCIEGNHTGATFATLTFGGVGFARTSAETANGTYDAGSTSTYWSWIIGPTITDGVTYAYDVT